MKIYFKVADAYFHVDFTEPEDNRDLIGTCAPFHVRTEEGAAQPQMLSLTVGRRLVNAEPEGEEVGQFDCGGMTHGVYKIADGYKFLLRNLDNEIACAMYARDSFTRCEVSLFGDEKNRSFGMTNAMMIAFAYAGAANGIVLMHASVIMFEGRGYLFLGKSGTGKSTHTGLWLKHIENCELLNDDNPAVRFFPDGRVIVYGSPWSGKTPCYKNKQVPVGAFVRLEQYPENIIAKENVLRSFASILSSCSTMIWDKPSYNAICDTVTGIVEHTKTFHLRCLPDEAAARLSNATITR